ncbi:hypothetical protein QBC43DRAFT_283224 [Cladorrhinum sp. PSN259]|nr:hypothetical protein QBC43DRAFT_283224 [Cladorrhinum sp. PSN259]
MSSRSWSKNGSINEAAARSNSNSNADNASGPRLRAGRARHPSGSPPMDSNESLMEWSMMENELEDMKGQGWYRGNSGGNHSSSNRTPKSSSSNGSGSSSNKTSRPSSNNSSTSRPSTGNTSISSTTRNVNYVDPAKRYQSTLNPHNTPSASSTTRASIPPGKGNTNFSVKHYNSIPQPEEAPNRPSSPTFEDMERGLKGESYSPAAPASKCSSNSSNKGCKPLSSTDNTRNLNLATPTVSQPSRTRSPTFDEMARHLALRDSLSERNGNA